MHLDGGNLYHSPSMIMLHMKVVMIKKGITIKVNFTIKLLVNSDVAIGAFCVYTGVNMNTWTLPIVAGMKGCEWIFFKFFTV